MNGPGAPSLWQEARNTDGRVYYYNVQTKMLEGMKGFHRLFLRVQHCLNACTFALLRILAHLPQRHQQQLSMTWLLILPIWCTAMLGAEGTHRPLSACFVVQTSQMNA